jgi:O-antigen ligase
MEELSSFASNIHPKALASSFVLLLRSPENSVVYAISSAFMAASAVALAQAIGVVLGRQLALLFKSLLCGLLLTLGVGLCDYYGVISLLSLRALDPVVNPGNFQFRMQSFFGHSGWFAEFLTLSIPFSLVILSFKRLSYWQRVLSIIVLLVLGEYCLLLSYQRGGWLSYPFTLLIVWFAIYVFSSFEKGRFVEGVDSPTFSMRRALRASFSKVAISLPLTIAVTLFSISFILGESIFNTQEGSYTDQYVQRFKSMTKASDRLEFVEAGYKLGTLHPFLGGGVESFAYRYEKEFVRESGAFFKANAHPLHGSAHNVYAQIFAGTGLVGLILFLMALWRFGAGAFRLALYDEEVSQEHRLLLLSGVCFVFAVAVYGMVQEVFYIHSLRLLVFIVLGVMPFLAPVAFRVRRRAAVASLCFIFLMTVFHLLWVLRGSFDNYPSDFGCYGVEFGDKSSSYRWCRPKARRWLSLVGAAKDRVAIDVEVPRIEGGKPFDLLRLEIGGDLLVEHVMRAGDRWQEEVIVPSQLRGRALDGRIPVEFFFGSSFVPALDNMTSGSAKDYRLLSFKLYENRS